VSLIIKEKKLLITSSSGNYKYSKPEIGTNYNSVLVSKELHYTDD